MVPSQTFPLGPGRPLDFQSFLEFGSERGLCPPVVPFDLRGVREACTHLKTLRDPTTDHSVKYSPKFHCRPQTSDTGTRVVPILCNHLTGPLRIIGTGLRSVSNVIGIILSFNPLVGSTTRPKSHPQLEISDTFRVGGSGYPETVDLKSLYENRQNKYLSETLYHTYSLVLRRKICTVGNILVIYVDEQTPVLTRVTYINFNETQKLKSSEKKKSYRS